MSNPIVGIGELLWDVFPDGRKVAGGAPFNFAFHCQQLGHDAVIVSRVGDDDLGRELRAEVRRLGLSDEFIQTDTEHPTGTVRVTVDANGQPSYEIVEDVAWDYIADEQRLTVLAEFASAVCYGSLARRQATARAAIEAFVANVQSDCKVFDVNIRTSSIDPIVLESAFYQATWVKVNESEFQALKPVLVCRSSRSLHDLGHLLTVLTHRTILLTKGQDGCEVMTHMYPPHLTGDLPEPGVPAHVVDTVGAGDSFTAAIICLHLEGRPLRECARFATHYAARVCEHRGATPRIDRAEVERAAFG